MILALVLRETDSLGDMPGRIGRSSEVRGTMRKERSLRLWRAVKPRVSGVMVQDDPVAATFDTEEQRQASECIEECPDPRVTAPVISTSVSAVWEHLACSRDRRREPGQLPHLTRFLYDEGRS